MPSHLSFLIANGRLFLRCIPRLFCWHEQAPCEVYEGSKQPIFLVILVGFACPAKKLPFVARHSTGLFGGVLEVCSCYHSEKGRLGGESSWQGRQVSLWETKKGLRSSGKCLGAKSAVHDVAHSG